MTVSLAHACNLFGHRIHHFFSSVSVLAWIAEGTCCKRKELCQAWIVCTHISLDQSLGPRRTSEGAPGVGEGPSWGSLPAATPAQIRLVHLYPVNTKSSPFFSDSYSDSHFFFRIGWTLLRKLKNRFEVSSFGLLCVEIGRFSKSGVIWNGSSYPHGWCEYGILKNRLRSQILSLAGWSSSDTH